MNTKKTKISIIGAGFVGATCAYSLMIKGLTSEIVIVDINKEKALGEVMDLGHGVSFVNPVNIHSGDFCDTKNSDIVIITAGAAQKEGETRIDLINRNLSIFKSIIPEIVKYNPNAILLVVSNPVDILTYITYKLSGFPKEKVIGSGTVLDTSRFKYLLGKQFDIDSRNIHAYIMGEHGDSEIATWSLTSVAGMNVDEYASKICNQYEDFSKENILKDVKNAAYQIIEKKGATYYAVGLAVSRIVEAILRNEHSILTVSSLLNGEYNINNICLGVPCIVGADGIKDVLQVPLNEEELTQLTHSADTLKEISESLKL